MVPSHPKHGCSPGAASFAVTQQYVKQRAAMGCLAGRGVAAEEETKVLVFTEWLGLFNRFNHEPV